MAAAPKTATAKTAEDAIDGPSLGDRVEATVRKGDIAKPEAKAKPQTVSAVVSKPIAAVAASIPVVKAKSASATNAHPVESAPCHPEAKPCLPRTQDEIWLVSTRCLGCPDVESATPDYGVWRYDLNTHQWDQSTLQAFEAAQEPSKPDVVWVHGYRIDASEAEEQGLGVYEQLTDGVSGDHPIRLVDFLLGRHSVGWID